jgi:NAD(P)-dependent dehydrogenase (short-subunit alcohol dehydrogenase family)
VRPGRHGRDCRDGRQSARRPRRRRHPDQQRRTVDSALAGAVLRPDSGLPADDAVEYLGAVELILKFIPGTRERQFGHVVNLSSAGVQIRAPRFGAYIASKAALDTLCDSLQAETVSDNVRFTTVHMALVRTPMIKPTTTYERFPTLTPEQAAGVLADAIVHPPRRVSSPFGQFASVADAVNPMVMDFVRNRASNMFDDSSAEQGKESAEHTSKFDKRSEAFVRATRGIHW